MGAAKQPLIIKVPAGLAVSVAAVMFVGQLATNFSPFLLRAAMLHARLDEAGAATLISTEFIAFLIAALALAKVEPARPDRTAMLGCLAYAVGSLCSAAATAPWQLGAARFGCGLGEGVAMATALRVMASQLAFERLVAIAVISGTFLASVGLIAFPVAIEQFGTIATYCGLAGIGFIGAALTGSLSLGLRTDQLGSGPLKRSALVVLGGYLCSRLSDSAIWPFAERLGARAALSEETVGAILAAVTVLALAAPLVVLRARKNSRLWLLSGAIFAKSMTALVMLIWPDASVFIAAQALQVFALVMTLQLAMMWFAEADAGGRVAIIGGVAGMIADAAGPAAASVSFAAYGLGGIVGVSLITGLFGSVLLMSVARQREGESRR